MSDGTKIEWTDATWNIITGCSVVSAGCKHCYAMKLAGTRLRNTPSRKGLTIATKAGPVWNGEVRFNEKWLSQPLQWKRPRRIFVCAHGDLFHENVPDDWIDKVFAVMALCPQHTFQVLTKRPDRMLAWATHDKDGRWGYVDGRARQIWREHSGKEFPVGKMLPFKPLPNVWLGVSVENQETADDRIPFLLRVPAAVRFLSCEPLLGALDLSAHFQGYCPEHDFPAGFCLPRHHEGVQHISWVIVGGESGPGARPMHPDWARNLRDQCESAGVAFFFKQWGDWKACGDPDVDYTGSEALFLTSDGQVFKDCHDGPLGVQVRADRPHLQQMNRVGKKAAGRHLDGRAYDGMPA